MLLGKRLQQEDRDNGTPVSVSLSKRPCFSQKHFSDGFEPLRQEEELFDEEISDVGAGCDIEREYICSRCVSPQIVTRCVSPCTPNRRPICNSGPATILPSQQEENGDATLLQLPEDLVLHILSFLSAPDLVRVMAVSKPVSGLCHKEYLWRRLTLLDYRRDLIFFQANCSLLLFLTGWKGFYRAISTMRIDLEFLTGPRSPSIQTIPKRSVSIGRSRSNDVCVLQDEMISRRHAVISFHHNRL